MRSMSNEDICYCLVEHSLWLEDLKPSQGFQFDISSLDVSEKCFKNAHLIQSKMQFTNAYGADFRWANLQFANCQGMDARYTNFADANCRNGVFTAVDFKYANLRDVDFSNADLSYADLRGANLTDCDFEGANMKGVLRDEHTIVPTCGSFTAYACVGGYIVVLSIPYTARRLNPIGSRRCRCSEAEVLWMEVNDKRCMGKVPSSVIDHRSGITYTEGSNVTVEDFDEDVTHIYGKGIVFYLTKAEAGGLL